MSDLYWLTNEQMARLEPYALKSHGKHRVDDSRVLTGSFSSIATGCSGVTDANGHPISLFMTAYPVSDYTGAAALLNNLPKAQRLLLDRAMTRAGSGTPCRPGVSRPASQVGNPGPSLSVSTSGDTKAGTALRSCSAGSKTGVASPHDMTDARPSSYPPSPSRLPALLAMSPEPSRERADRPSDVIRNQCGRRQDALPAGLGFPRWRIAGVNRIQICQRQTVKLYDSANSRRENQMPELTSIPDKPIMPPAAVARLERALVQSECYLEYGSGGSTAMANRLGVPVSISVESDRTWLDTLRAGLILTPSVRRIFLHADIGPTREWGHPINELKWRSWHEYPLAAWRTCQDESLDPDVVLIDGRFRKACFYATLIFGRPGATILFDDYENRIFYREVEIFARPSVMYERLAEFVIPDIVDKNPLWIAFTEAVTDQR